MNGTKRRLTLADLKRAAALHGATVKVEDHPREWACTVLAPTSTYWSCSPGTHALAVWCYEGDPDAKSEVIADALERIAAGVEPCDIPDCDVCNEED